MGNATYVRWRVGESRRGRVFPALPQDAPPHRGHCVGCGEEIGLGPVQLLAVGPTDPDDSEAKLRYAQGRWFNCGATIMHAGCLSMLTDAEVEALVMDLEIHLSQAG